MKLATATNTIDSSEDLETKRFGVSDNIQGLLRKNLYSSPQQTCIQEVICNARDANRENHRPTIPIKISGLNLKNPSLVIRDSGVGISPKRLEYFCTYGASTKTKSDTQTGGWGLGCKSPFAITDSFILDTVYVDQDDATIKWHCTYNLFIDEQGFSSATPLIKEIVDSKESTYTEIQIPFESSSFRSAIEDVTRAVTYWGHVNVRTTVPPDISALGEGNVTIPETSITEISRGVYSSFSRQTMYLTLIVDGIIYDSLKFKFLSNLPASRGMVLFYNTGDIDISPNRETISESPKTYATIENTLNTFWDGVNAEVDAFNNTLKDANPLETCVAISAWLQEKGFFYKTAYKKLGVAEINVSTKLDLTGFDVRLVECGTAGDGDVGEIHVGSSEKLSLSRIYELQKTGVPIIFQDTRSLSLPLVRGALTECPNGVIVISQLRDFTGWSRHYRNTKDMGHDERQAFMDGRRDSSINCIMEYFSESAPWSYLDKPKLLSSYPPIVIRKPRAKAPKPENMATRQYKGTYQAIPLSKKGVRIYVIKRGKKFYGSADKDACEVSLKNFSYAWTVHCSKAKKIPATWIPLSEYRKKHDDNREAKENKETIGQKICNNTYVGEFLTGISERFILPPSDLSRLQGEVTSLVGNDEYVLANKIQKRYPLIPFSSGGRHIQPAYFRHLYQYIKAISPATPKNYIP